MDPPSLRALVATVETTGHADQRHDVITFDSSNEKYHMNNGRLNFIGEKTPGGGAVEGTSPWQIVVRNKRTGKIKVIDADIVRLRPVFNQLADTDAVVSQTSAVETGQFSQRRDALTTAFGGKIQQRAVERRTKRRSNAVDRSIMDEVIDDGDNSLLSTSQQTLDTSLGSPNADSAMPPYNKDAKEPGEVYRFEQLVPLEVIESLRNKATKFASSSIATLKEEGYGQTALHLFQTLPSPTSKELRLSHAAYIIYFDSLSKMYQKAATNRQLSISELELVKIPEEIRENLFLTFTKDIASRRNFSHRSVTNLYRDKMLTYAIALNLLLNKGSVSLGLLMADLKLSMKKLESTTRAMGCSHAKDRNTGDTTATLRGLPPTKRSTAKGSAKGGKREVFG